MSLPLHLFMRELLRDCKECPPVHSDNARIRMQKRAGRSWYNDNNNDNDDDDCSSISESVFDDYPLHHPAEHTFSFKNIEKSLNLRHPLEHTFSSRSIETSSTVSTSSNSIRTESSPAVSIRSVGSSRWESIPTSPIKYKGSSAPKPPQRRSGKHSNCSQRGRVKHGDSSRGRRSKNQDVSHRRREKQDDGFSGFEYILAKNCVSLGSVAEEQYHDARRKQARPTKDQSKERRGLPNLGLKRSEKGQVYDILDAAMRDLVLSEEDNAERLSSRVISAYSA